MRRHLPLAALLTLLGVGCGTEATGPGTAPALEAARSFAAPGSDGPWRPVPADCTPPADPPADVLAVTASAEPIDASLVHLQEIALDEETGLVWATGRPAVVALQRAAEVIDVVGQYPTDGGEPEWQHVLPLGGGGLALTSRAHAHKPVEGLTILDVSDPTAPFVSDVLHVDQPSGMARHGSWLYVLQLTGDLTVVDATHPTEPTKHDHVSGLAHPWRMVVHGDVGYVADNALGIVVLDLSDPSAPVVVGHVDTAGGCQDVAARGSVLVAATGTAGIQTFDLGDDPLAPEPLATLSWGTAVVSVALDDDGHVWATDHEGVLVADVHDPASPTPVATEDSPWWALDVLPLDDGTAWLCDWVEVHTLALDASGAAPDADPEVDALYGWPDSDPRLVAVANRGGAALELTGAQVEDPRFSVTADRLVAGPGESLQLRVAFAADGAPVDTTLCVATNDPDEPVRMVTLSDTSVGSTVPVGEPAPDFALQALDGVYHSLSDHLGSPVVLLWFASW